MKKKEVFYFFLSLIFLLTFVRFVSAENENLNIWFEYKIRGNYGNLPQQPEFLEKGYWWWKEGTLGYWENSLSITAKGCEHFGGYPVKYLLEIGTVSTKDKRDYEVWSDDYSPALKMKQANVEFGYMGFYLKAGKTLLEFPLFFKDRVYGAIAGYRFRKQNSDELKTFQLEINWYQIMAYEGKYIEEDINYNDDIDLQGGEISIDFNSKKWYDACITSVKRTNLIFQNKIFIFKLTDAGSGRLGSNVNIYGGNIKIGTEYKFIEFGYCHQQGDYYGYELKDYLYRYKFETTGRVIFGGTIVINAEFLGRGSKKGYNENYSFFNLLEEPVLDNYIFKPSPAMVDRLSFELTYEYGFDKIENISLDLLYLIYHFDHADYNTGEEFNLKFTVGINENLNLDFALGVSSFNGFYKGVFLTYRGKIL
ncbi:hypothetical protein KAU33_07115 [Candidatus Dependentiae bacterium]|nr:hypothetical protein [Candidatus Dependentiae bacterium]